jgi:hypothetical protein
MISMELLKLRRVEHDFFELLLLLLEAVISHGWLDVAVVDGDNFAPSFQRGVPRFRRRMVVCNLRLDVSLCNDF